MEVVNDRSSSTGATTATFDNVLISTLDENGIAQPKYTFPVSLIAEYDPEVS